MFSLTQSMGATAAIEAARNKHKIFGSVEIGGLTVSFEAMLYPDLNLALELHVVEGGRPIEAYTTLTVRGRHHDPLRGGRNPRQDLQRKRTGASTDARIGILR